MEQWYTLHAKPNKEYQVATTLQRRNLQVYLPEIEAANARAGRKFAGRKVKPFFPGYLFVNVDFEAVGLSNLEWIPGLHRIVAFDGCPVPVPGEVIDLIRYKLGEGEAVGGWPEHTFQPGDTVRIIDGPFRGMLAIFDESTTPAKRVQVLLSILGASRVQVDVADLEKVDAEAPAPKRRPRRTRGRGRRINY